MPLSLQIGEPDGKPQNLDEPPQPSVLRHLQSQQIGNSEEHATTTRFHQQIGDPVEHASSVFKYNSDEELATTQLRQRTGNNQVSSSSDEVSRR